VSSKANSEAAFQLQIEQLARFYGWRVFHAPDNRPSGKTGRVQRVEPGFPDLVLLRPPDIIFAELKTDTGRLSAAQREWHDELSSISDSIASLTLEAFGEQRMDGFGGPLPAWTPSVHAFVWKPRDFEVIHMTLARGRRRVEPTYGSAA
jgi:hypothetical protein